jgi:hypothetical protein
VKSKAKCRRAYASLKQEIADITYTTHTMEPLRKRSGFVHNAYSTDSDHVKFVRGTYKIRTAATSLILSV